MKSERLTPNQFGTLKYIKLHQPIHVSEIETYHQGTLGALVQRKLVAKYGRNQIVTTEKGDSAVEPYVHSKVALRTEKAELTERVSNLLKLVRIRREK